MRVQLRPTRPEDLQHVLPGPLPCRIKAITADLEGRVLGVGGVGYRPDGVVVAFASFTDEMRKYPAAIHRAGIAGKALFAAAGQPVIAEAQPHNPAAAAWLERLGFVKRGEVYVWNAGDDAS